MITQASVVIVGAGAFGSSVAFHLARAGRDVVLLDQYELASQTSSRAAGLSGQIRASSLMTQLAVASVKKIERFSEETGQPMAFFQPGSLKIARNHQHEQDLLDQVRLGKSLGLDIEFVSPADAHRLMPLLEETGVVAATYMRTDLYVAPSQVPLGYAKAATGLGANLLTNTRVTGIEVKDGTIFGVRTDRGLIETEAVVDAAGCWLQLVAEMAGTRTHVVPTRHQLMITEPIQGVESSQPIIRIIDANVYIRPDDGGLMLGGYERLPVQYDIHMMPPAFQIADLSLDLDVLRALSDSVRQQFPVLQHAKIREHRGGLPTMTPDGNLLVGPVSAIKGLYVIGGCCVGGLLMSPIIGELLAEWIVSGKAPLDLSLMSPDRAALSVSDDDLRSLCAYRYGHQYWSPGPGGRRPRGNFE
jgi:glycine/D-amino acid oxidase-like deaminating enzyme